MLLDNLDTVLSTLQITHASFVPSLLDQTGLRPEDTPDLVFLLSGGEKMPARVKKDWASHDRVSLVNAYGPTEVTIGCCSARISADSDVPEIGTPLGDTVAHVLIPETNDYALRGMTGELCFTGSLVGKGYYKRPEAKGFEDDFNGQRMYRTGDMVRLQENGHLHYLNRKDDQVKIRGQRVELGEVSERVRMVSEEPIDTAALVLKHPHLARPQLVVFTTRAASKRKGPENPKIMLSELGNNSNRLKEQCQKSLPSYMVPDLIIPLEFMPLATNSGKSDSKSLASIFSGTSAETLFQAGTVSKSTGETLKRELNEPERRILDIISSTTKQIPKHTIPQTTAVELGVDSLSAITLLPKLRAKGYSCTLTTLLGNPTLASLSKLTEDTHPASGAKTLDVHQILTSLEDSFLQQVALSDRAKIAAVRPCFPLQEAIVAQSLDATTSQSDAYVYHFRFKLKKDAVVPRLQSAWESLVHTHEILRTCFGIDEDRAVQIVLHNSEQESSWASTRIPDPEDTKPLQATVASSIVSEIAIRAPIRVSHVMCNGERDLLIFSIHHALYDGSSFDIMMEEWQKIYAGKGSSAISIVPLIDYIVNQNEAEARKFWSAVLQDWQRAHLLLGENMENESLVTVQRTFAAKLSHLEDLTSFRNFTLATLLQTGCGIALARWLKTDDLMLGAILSGRTVPVENVERIMAPCITTVPMRVRLDQCGGSAAQMLSQAQVTASSSLAFQHFSPR